MSFADLSEDQDQEWFADGLTEEILNSLARLPELLVTARTSSFEFKNTNTDISEIALRLGVEHVVEGSVRKIGDDLRVTAQLIRAKDGFHLWSETYNRKSADLFDVQLDVAQNIAEALDVVLDSSMRERLLQSGTRDIEAFKAHRQGIALFEQAHARSQDHLVTLADANILFEQALALDPKVLFFDEPSAGLDPISARKLDELIIEVRDTLGATIVVVTHELASIFAIGNKSVFLDPETKTMIAEGDPKELRDHCENQGVRDFLLRGELEAAHG